MIILNWLDLFFQDLYLNMPFQSWELRPHATNSCLFALIAASIELEIEIKVYECIIWCFNKI